MKYCRKEDDVFYHTVMTKTKTKTKTKCREDPTYAIFSKSREFKKTDAEITKTNTKTYTKTKTQTKCIEDPTYAIFLKTGSSRILNMTRPDQTDRPTDRQTDQPFNHQTYVQSVS